MKVAALATIVTLTTAGAAEAGTWMTADVGRAVDLSTLQRAEDKVTFTEVVASRNIGRSDYGGVAGQYALYQRSIDCKSHAITTLQGGLYAISLGPSGETVTTHLSVKPDPLPPSDGDVERIACGPAPQADDTVRMSATNYVAMLRAMEGWRMPPK